MLQGLCEPRVVGSVMSDEITLKQEGTCKTLQWAQVLVQICRSGSWGTSHYVNDRCLSWAVCFNTQA